MIQKNLSRRELIKFAALGIGASCIPSLGSAQVITNPRTLALSNLHTGESLESQYFDGRQYVKPELRRLDKLCRDHRRNEVYPMDKVLFDQIDEIQRLLGITSEVLIISGYRSPATNATLRSKSSGVAKKSFHMTGQAVDFRLDGVKLSHVREAAITLKAGGVGYYPSSNFVHIDTGHVRSWRG